MPQTEAKPPIGRAADGSTYAVGDDVLIRARVMHISDAFREVTYTSVRIPERIDGVSFVTLEEASVQTLAPKSAA